MLRRGNSLITAGACVLALSIGGEARGASPQLDPRFAGDGISDLLVGGAQEILVQRDRKVVVASSTSCGEQGLDFGLARFKPDGSRDMSFGRRGKVCVDSGQLVDSEVRSAALQPNGKIVVAGGTAPLGGFGETRLMRFTPRGRLDRSFARDGVFTRTLGDGIGDEFANGVAIDRDGGIVIAGQAGRRIAVARLTARGALDRRFGERGVTATPTGLWTDVVLERSGRIIVAGGTNGFEAAALTPRGRLDRSFGDQGLVEVDTGINRGAWDLDRTGGQLTLVGAMRIPEGRDDVPSGYEIAPAAVRLDSDGELDRSFGGDGIAIVPIGTWNPEDRRERQGSGLAVERQRGGATLIAAEGRYWDEAQNQYGDGALTLIRLRRDGSVDPGFGTDGVALTDIYAEPGLFLGSALDAKDRLLVGAWTADAARFLAP